MYLRQTWRQSYLVLLKKRARVDVRFVDDHGNWEYTELETLLVVGLRLHVLRQIAFRLEGEAAVVAVVRSQVRVRANVLLQHARFLTAYSTTLAHVMAPSPPPNVHVLLASLITPREDHHPFRCVHRWRH